MRPIRTRTGPTRSRTTTAVVAEFLAHLGLKEKTAPCCGRRTAADGATSPAKTRTSTSAKRPSTIRVRFGFLCCTADRTNYMFSPLITTPITGALWKGCPLRKGRRAKCKLSPQSAFLFQAIIGVRTKRRAMSFGYVVDMDKISKIFWPSMIRPLDRELQASIVRNFLA